MERRAYLKLMIIFIVFAVFCITLVLCIQEEYYASALGLILGGLTLMFYAINLIKNKFLKIEKYIDCIYHEDFTNHINQSDKVSVLQHKVGLLNSKLKGKSQSDAFEFNVFSNIIESLSIGVLILKKQPDHSLSIYSSNSAFSQFLHIPKYYDWSLLSKKITPLLPYLSENNWTNQKLTISLVINQKEEHFFLKTSVTKTKNASFLILTLETIQQLIEKKEKESWYKLMNVMSHEIINSITPVKSLAENLQYLVEDETASSINNDTIDELKEGLEIINKRSNSITQFVDTYRRLTELPKPHLQPILIHKIINNTIKLVEKDLKDKAISLTFSYTETPYILGDQIQLEQVLINLITNSTFALIDSKSKKQIELFLYTHNKKVFVKITDNGSGISDEIKANIFVPYFTTRKQGSGIGLTLTKSILQAHNAHIYLENAQQPTVFMLSFPMTNPGV